MFCSGYGCRYCTDVDVACFVVGMVADVGTDVDRACFAVGMVADVGTDVNGACFAVEMVADVGTDVDGACFPVGMVADVGMNLVEVGLQSLSVGSGVWKTSLGISLSLERPGGDKGLKLASWMGWADMMACERRNGKFQSF